MFITRLDGRKEEPVSDPFLMSHEPSSDASSAPDSLRVDLDESHLQQPDGFR